ncbi:MAG: hypothetical protein OEZ06_13360 [Myxococcales bacterium]|nr:hypothetical protein [Myxococcales bacterium]
MSLPPCGLYRTTAAIASIPEGRLVYFHNHGDPGPGLYLPESWKANRMQLSPRGTLLPSPEDVRYLEPLPPEGFYRVVEAFDCCDKKCRRFEQEALLQLGYNGEGHAIVFVPEWVDGMLAIPERGSRIDAKNFERIKRLRVPESQPREVH